MPWTHRHNAYCGEDTHCDLLYYSGTSPEVLGARFERLAGVTVLGVEPAREAPEVEAMLAQGYESLTESDPAGARTPYLVWWQGDWEEPR